MAGEGDRSWPRRLLCGEWLASGAEPPGTLNLGNQRHCRREHLLPHPRFRERPVPNVQKPTGQNLRAAHVAVKVTKCQSSPKVRQAVAVAQFLE